MPTQQTLLAFALVSAGIMLIPGPSNFLLLAHGIGHGRRSALAAMASFTVARLASTVAARRVTTPEFSTCKPFTAPS